VGVGDVAEASLSPGGGIVVWLRPARMGASQADVEALHRRLDDIQRAIASGPDPAQREDAARARPVP
jgi:hypothetical protein